MTQVEIWVPIKGYEDCYEISSRGRIRSYDRVVARTRNGPRTYKGQIRNSSRHSHGYRSVGLWKNGKGKQFLIHRLVAQHFIPNPDTLPDINHIDGVKTNNAWSNLQWCTKSQNTRHGYDNNLIPSGEKHSSSKLKEVEVCEMRRRYKQGETLTKLSHEFDIAMSHVHNIVNYKIWNRINCEI
jgi:hypothetical protein